MRALPYQDLGFAKVDHHRAHRHGTPEVIFCQGKTPDQVCRIAQALAGAGQAVLATRASREHFDALEGVLPDLVYFEDARVIGPRALEDEERGQGAGHGGFGRHGRSARGARGVADGPGVRFAGAGGV